MYTPQDALAIHVNVIHVLAVVPWLLSKKRSLMYTPQDALAIHVSVIHVLAAAPWLLSKKRSLRHTQHPVLAVHASAIRVPVRLQNLSEYVIATSSWHYEKHLS